MEVCRDSWEASSFCKCSRPTYLQMLYPLLKEFFPTTSGNLIIQVNNLLALWLNKLNPRAFNFSTNVTLEFLFELFSFSSKIGYAEQVITQVCNLKFYYLVNPSIPSILLYYFSFYWSLMLFMVFGYR